MRQALGLWPDQWIPMNTEAGGEVAGDRWLFIAYAFGRQALFTQLSKELILTSTVDAGGGGSLLAPLPISNIACGINCYIPYSILGTWGSGVRVNFLVHADMSQRKLPHAANRP